jgi:hypothetical protein
VVQRRHAHRPVGRQTVGVQLVYQVAVQRELQDCLQR